MRSYTVFKQYQFTVKENIMSIAAVAVLIAIAAIAVGEAVTYRIMKDEKSAAFPRAQPE